MAQPVTLDPDGRLRFRARPGDHLYDCHSKSFAAVDGQGDLASRFTSLYLSIMYRLQPGQWPAFMRQAFLALDRLSPAERDDYVRERRPRVDARAAGELALAALPAAARYFTLPAAAPFELRPEHLFQANVELGGLQHLAPGAGWSDLFAPAAGLDAESRQALRAVLGRAASGRHPVHELARAGAEAAVVSALAGAGLLVPTPGAARDRPPPLPGLYLTGHSSLLVRGARAGILIDPQLTSSVGADSPGRLGAIDVEPWTDAVALTHGHFDHYHLPSLLQLADRPLLVPAVPQATLVCEDMAARLRSFGAAFVRPLDWEAPAQEVGDLRLHVLPFVGEQFLTSEIYPQARNWGNCYVVEWQERRVLVAVDTGFEPGRSILDLVAGWVARNGPIDVVVAQAIALRTAFGEGDPDLRITALSCARRADEAIELLRPEHRVTLAPEDLPLLCRAAGARRLVLYGQFRFRRGAAAVEPRLLARVARALEGSGIECRPPHVGQGLGFAAGWPTVTL